MLFLHTTGSCFSSRSLHSPPPLPPLHRPRSTTVNLCNFSSTLQATYILLIPALHILCPIPVHERNPSSVAEEMDDPVTLTSVSSIGTSSVPSECHLRPILNRCWLVVSMFVCNTNCNEMRRSTPSQSECEADSKREWIQLWRHFIHHEQQK